MKILSKSVICLSILYVTSFSTYKSLIWHIYVFQYVSVNYMEAETFPPLIHINQNLENFCICFTENF